MNTSAKLAAALLLALSLMTPAPATAEPAAAPDASVDRAIRAGDSHYGRRELRQAIESWSRADRLLRSAASDPTTRMSVLARLARARQALGRYVEAARDLEASLAIAESSGQDAAAATLEGALGRVLYLAGDDAGARRHLDACLVYAQAVEDGGLRASALNDLGNLVAATDPAAALALHREASGLAARAGRPALAVTAALNQARARFESGDLPGAEAMVVDMLAVGAASRDTGHDAMWWLGAGRLLARIGEVRADSSGARDASINRAYGRAAELAIDSGDGRVLALALGSRGALYEARGRFDEALQLTRRALFEAVRSRAPEIAYRWQWQLARLHAALGDATTALGAYRQAVATLQSLRRETLGGAWRAKRSLQSSANELYLELAEALLAEAGQRHGGQAERASQSLLREARETVELSKSVELETYFQDDCVAALQASASAVEEISGTAAALYPILLRDRVELLVSFPGRMLHVGSPVARAELLESVRSFRGLLARRTLQYRRPAAKLYDALIRPIEAALRAEGIDTLVFIPGGALRTIPVSALYDGERHLIEKFAVALAPGLTLLDARPLSHRDVDPLIGGISQSVQGFAPLPHVTKELETVQAIVGGEIYRDEGFVTATVRRALDLRPYSIVHLASHARIASASRDSFLLTYDGRMDMDELERFVKRSRFRDDPVELLTLSACDTALGDERAALGLAGVAIKAGARSALASLWLINDQAASELVSAFYLELKQGRSKAAALRHAQLRMLADQRYRFPVYWAPFLLIGNWL